MIPDAVEATTATPPELDAVVFHEIDRQLAEVRYAHRETP